MTNSCCCLVGGACSCLCLGVSVYQDGRLVVGTFPDLAAGSGAKKSTDNDGGSSNDKIADVVFIKTRPEPVTEANLHEVVQVSSIQAASPLSSFYHTVHQVYGPLLLRTPEWSAKLSTGLQQLLAGRRPAPACPTTNALCSKQPVGQTRWSWRAVPVCLPWCVDARRSRYQAAARER